MLLLAVAFVAWGLPNERAAAFVRAYPLVVLAAGAILSWRFHRTRLLLALIVLALADRGLVLAANEVVGAASDTVADGGGATLVVFHSIALLLPLNLVALAFLRDRSALTSAGLLRIAAILAQSALVWMLYRSYPVVPESSFELRLFAVWPAGWSPLAQPALVLFAIVLVMLAIRTLFRPDPVTRGFLWATAASVAALNAARPDGTTTFYFATAGLILIVAAIESAYSMAYHDDLTGLPGRRALGEALQRAGSEYTVAMVDVDHFKQFNDRHGHDVGDQVLRLVATRLAHVGGGGRAFRYGGEEFTLLFPGQRLRDSIPWIDAVRADVEDTGFIVRGAGRPRRKPKRPAKTRGTKRLAVTVSIGVAEATNGRVTANDIIKAADRALYRAKEAGRNRVEW
ncbi:MAG: diguanylate cyclase [Gemmatimonadaceae bacterium]